MQRNPDLTNSTLITTIYCVVCGYSNAVMTHAPIKLKSGSILVKHESMCFRCLCKPQ